MLDKSMTCIGVFVWKGTMSVLNLYCFAMQGWTALHHAACNGHAEFVTLLLDKDANKTTASKMVGASAHAVAADTRLYQVLFNSS